MNSRVLAEIARKHGPRLLEQALDRLIADPRLQAEAAAPAEKLKKASLGRLIANAALVRVATRSVPGAIIVSGGLIAKALHDRRKAKRAPTKFGNLR